MADAVVEFLLENLKQLLLYHVDLLSGVKDQVESLHRELSLMKAFLKDSREKRSEYEYVRELVSQITIVAYEAEDIIDTFVVNAAAQKARSTMKRVIYAFDHSSKLRNVAKEIQTIKVKVKEIYDKKLFGIVNLHQREPSRRITPQKKAPIVEEENVVGFNEEAKFLDFVSSKPYRPHVRSFMCFALEEVDLPREHTSFIQEAFRLVRVVDLRCISFSRFPNEIVQLVHLRYIAISGNFKVLPASISNLWNLQTLIVGTKSRELDIKVDIWKMSQFRHLYTSALSCLCGPPAQTRKDNEDPFVRRNIQTISTVSPSCCTENILARAPGLRKLGIRGKLVTLVTANGGSVMFDNLAKLDHLETLKLLNDTFPLHPSQCQIPSLPQWYKFPPNLKKLTLSDTFLDWQQISTLGMLPNLEVLKLKDYAFKGTHWEPLDGGFRLLRVLHIGRTDLVVWNASSHHFPRLQHVLLRHCEKLVGIPPSLGEVSSLQNVELYWPLPSAAASARLIQTQKVNSQLLQGIVNNSFKLFIYPPDL
nr:putative disease resistance RPP13-like protein 3 [Ipomoea batatas]